MTDQADRLRAALADRYRIERELGAGGMATVYLAEDIRHQRKVAIKLLKPELAAVLGAERFIQEIKTTAALQHPHILPLFDSGQADGFLFYVMPYIEGETLRDKLNRDKHVGIEEAIRITREVADALDYAHRHGVIHRDIKPENILLHDGRPMVADFGIALAVSAAAGGRMTETGLSLGTPHYMSPEQATGDRDISARSDVYSLASVMYEMLAGEPPHLGGTAQQIIMKIIAEPVALVTTHRRNVPPNVAAALAQALEKLPADRFDSARAFSDALASSGFRTAVGTAGRVSTTGSDRGARIAAAIATLVAIAALGFGLHQRRLARQVAPAATVRFSLGLSSGLVSTNVSANSTNLAISPDGRTIAYAVLGGDGTPQVWVRPLDAAMATAIPGTSGAQQPAFSPDGEWIAYLVGTSSVWKVQLNGTAPTPVGNFTLPVVGLTWSAAGYIIGGTPRGLEGLPAGGGPSRLLATTDSANGELFFNQPKALPDGKTVLFAIQPRAGLSQTRLGSVTLPSGEVTRYDLIAFDPITVVDGTLIYVQQSGNVMGVPIDLSRGRIPGNPVSLGVAAQTTVAGSSMFAMSPTGTAAYQPLNLATTVGWVAPGGKFEPIASTPQAYAYPRLSPDGQRIALTVGSGEQASIWLYDLVSATLVRLTEAGKPSERPEWTPDGQRVLFRTERDGPTAIWWQPADMSATATPLQAGIHLIYEGVISPDGKSLVYQLDDADATQANVMYRALEGDTTSRPIAQTTAIESQARFSPDGKWVAYVTDASGVAQVVVRPFPGPGGQVQVSGEGGVEPVWSRDGRRLFYRGGGRMMAASITTTPQFAVTGRVELFKDDYLLAIAPHANYDVSPDGTRFLVIKPTTQVELSVVYGWLSEVRAKLRGAAR
ncbi:MAG TPA: protein kinase [Micromonosporaceae bacterium]